MLRTLTLVVVVGLMCLIRGLEGQTPQSNEVTDVAFEVVSVKSTGPITSLPADADRKHFASTRPFRFTDRSVRGNQTLGSIIRQAYSIEGWELSGPGWIGSLTYDIAAMMPAGTSKETALLMLRTMLTARFGLKFHKEKRDIPVYALMAAKKGFRLKEAIDPASFFVEMRPGSYVATGTVDSMAGSFRNYTDRPIVNMAEIKGIFHLELHWAPEDTGGASGMPHYDALFWATVEREVGLKLEKRNLSRDVMVIDHLEREPTPN